MAKIQHRNKRLLIAERFGWPTADAYELDPLADDSVDKKRLKRAQKDAKKARAERLRHRKVRISRKIFDIQTESTNQSRVFLNAQMSLQLTPDQHNSAVGHAKVMATTPDSVAPPYHPIQFRTKGDKDQESMVNSVCNHEFGSHEGESECELKVKVQNIEDFEQSNLFDEHISVSELNNSHTNVKEAERKCDLLGTNWG